MYLEHLLGLFGVIIGLLWLLATSYFNTKFLFIIHIICIKDNILNTCSEYFSQGQTMVQQN